MLPADAFSTAPVTLTLLVVSCALLALRAAAHVFDLGMSRHWSRALDVTTAGSLALFGLLVVIRFLTLA